MFQESAVNLIHMNEIEMIVFSCLNSSAQTDVAGRPHPGSRDPEMDQMTSCSRVPSRSQAAEKNAPLISATTLTLGSMSRLLRRLMERFWADAETAYRAKILDALAPDPSARLLDVGCDDGTWTSELRRKLGISPQQVSGIEILPERAALARARGFDVRISDLDVRWPFEDQSVDVVHANQVIEHVKHLDHFVLEIKRVLTQRGLALVCTENLASWHNIASLLLGFQPFSLTNISNRGPLGNPLALHTGEPPAAKSSQHVYVMTLEALRAIFVAHGFVIESMWGKGYHPLIGWPASRLACIDRRHAHFVGLVARLRA
jgi:SAM-dependent methyltransferase